MADQIKPKFIFESKALDRNTFHVVKFRGTEGLSSIYRFDITLISEKADLDLGEILQNPAEFTIKREDGDIPFKGILSSFEQLQQAGGYVFYRAELVPKLWWTTLTHHNQIFLNKNVQGLLEDVLKDGGLKQGLNFDFKLQGSYPTWEYLCQYDESHFNFVSRWLERDGMYYYFEQTDQGEKMVITDTHISHSPMPEGTALIYSPPSNMDHVRREEVVKNFMLKQQPLPRKVLLKDYNYRKPSLEMKAEALVSAKGMGEIYLYGEHFMDPGDGARLANIRAQEYLCREKVFHGVSTVPYVRTGYVFELKDHYRHDFNQRYLTTEVTHEGSQEAYLVSGLKLHLAKDEDRLYYRNSFSCIPATTQYRPERKTEKPKFHGSMNAKVDASGSGQYAELDSHGRYKVVLPLDTSGRTGGKATTWLRMAQPYSGSDHGMHFPLHKGTEVLLTCIDGDPDRPIIQAAVPNPETPSPVTDANQTQCRITTGGQNRIHMEDQKGSERILLHTPKSNTWMRMGTPNDPPASLGDWDREDEGGKAQDGWKLNTDKHIEVFAGSEATTILGNKFESIGGSSEEVIVGNDTKAYLGFKEDTVIGLEASYTMAKSLEYASSKTHLWPERVNLEGEVSSLAASRNRMEASLNALRGEVNHLEGENRQTVLEHTALAARHNQLAAQASVLVGETSRLAGAVKDLAGETQWVIGSVNSVCGAVSELAGERNAAIADDMQTIGGAVTLVGEQSTVAATASTVSAEINNVAGLVTTV